MNIKTIAVVALAAILVACLVPIAETDAVYSNVDGDPVIGTGDDAEYTITYTNHDYDSYQDLSMARQENQRLQDSIANMDTDEGVEEIARSKLGLAFPGEITYRDSGK